VVVDFLLLLGSCGCRVLLVIGFLRSSISCGCRFLAAAGLLRLLGSFGHWVLEVVGYLLSSASCGRRFLEVIWFLRSSYLPVIGFLRSSSSYGRQFLVDVGVALQSLASCRAAACCNRWLLVVISGSFSTWLVVDFTSVVAVVFLVVTFVICHCGH